MGAGKSTVGAEIAHKLGRRFVDADEEIERRTGTTIAALFERGRGLVPHGGGGGGRRSARGARADGRRARRRARCCRRAPGRAWTRWRSRCSSRSTPTWPGSDRAAPPGRSRRTRIGSARLYADRMSVYREVADAVARDADGAVLAAAGIHVSVGALELLGDLAPGEGRVALVADTHVAGIHGMDAQLALGGRLASTHEVAGKSVADLEAAVALAPARPQRHDRRPRRRDDDRPRGLCGGHVHARARLGRRPDQPRRAGGRGDRREDGDRPPRGEEPGRLIPLAGDDRDRPERSSPRSPRRSG